MKISANFLVKNRACGDQVALFKATFGHGRHEVTVENVNRAVAAGLYVEWLVRFVSPAVAVEYERQYALIRDEHRRQRVMILAEYERALALLLEERERQGAVILCRALAAGSESTKPNIKQYQTISKE